MSDLPGKDGDPDRPQDDSHAAIMNEPYWSLADTLAWVATRNPKALVQTRQANNPDIALTVWTARNSSADWPATSFDSAWAILAPTMCDGLTAFSTRRHKQNQSGAEQSEPGVLFPPPDAPGSPLSYRLEVQNRQAALVPTNRVFLHSWLEWTDFRFKRERVLEIFGPFEVVDPAVIAEQIIDPDENAERMNLDAEDDPAHSANSLLLEPANPAPRLTLGEMRLKRAIDESWPDGKLPGRADLRDEEIKRHYKDRREPPPTTRTIQRYLRKVRN